MSSGRNGSTRAWRKVRVQVLIRDEYRCRVRLPGVCTGVATHAHHTLGTSTGNDMRYLVAACAACNLKTGDPMRVPDPPLIPKARW